MTDNKKPSQQNQEPEEEKYVLNLFIDGDEDEEFEMDDSDDDEWFIHSELGQFGRWGPAREEEDVGIYPR